MEVEARHERRSLGSEKRPPVRRHAVGRSKYNRRAPGGRVIWEKPLPEEQRHVSIYTAPCGESHRDVERLGPYPIARHVSLAGQRGRFEELSLYGWRLVQGFQGLRAACARRDPPDDGPHRGGGGAP